MYDRDGLTSVFARLTLCLSLAASGCSLVYDFGAFEGVGDAGPPDVNPANLRLERTVPDQVDEGSGCLIADATAPFECDPELSPKIAVLVEGGDILDTARVTLTGMGFEATPVDATVDGRGQMLGFELAVPVDTDLDVGMSDFIEITVTQEGASESVELEVRGLAEAIATEPTDDTLYSVIEVSTAITHDDPSPLHLRATSLIAIAAGGSIEATGCSGGAAQTAGGCSGMGGGPGDDSDALMLGRNSGGGGGGNATAGDPGIGTDPPNGGAANGTPLLVPLSNHLGRGGGGGVGRTGGDGGGVIALTSGGSIAIRTTLDVSGADGASAMSCALITGASGGGGGAGGSVLLRAAELDVTGAQILVNGGGGGTSNNDNCNGGAGAPGRLRFDATTVAGDLTAAVNAATEPARGAAIDPQPHVLTGPPEHVIAITRDTEKTVFTSVGGGSVTQVLPNGQASVTLTAGRNNVCVHVTDPVSGVPPESVHCVDFLYLP